MRGRGVDRYEVVLGGDKFVVLSTPLADIEELTPAETQIACDVLDGLSTAAIGRKRGTSARTVANQLASIYRKLAINSRAELAAILGGRR